MIAISDEISPQWQLYQLKAAVESVLENEEGRMNVEFNVVPADSMLESPITLESVREAWLCFNATTKPEREYTPQEIEDYLRSSLFLIAAIAYKLKTAMITTEDAKRFGEELNKVVKVTEQASLYLCERRQSVRT